MRVCRNEEKGYQEVVGIVGVCVGGVGGRCVVVMYTCWGVGEWGGRGWVWQGGGVCVCMCSCLWGLLWVCGLDQWGEADMSDVGEQVGVRACRRARWPACVRV